MTYQKTSYLGCRGFSMVEVMVASVIFAMAAAGIFATINYVSRPAVVDSKLEAALVAKTILDDLDREVYPNSAALADGTHNLAACALPGCSVVYTVTTDALGFKKVTLNVHWDPPAP